MTKLFLTFLIKENQLYYDPTTGIYYYCDVESGRYQFHSRVDLQSYQASGSQHTRDKKGKKKRKETEWNTANEYKVTSELIDINLFCFFMMQLRGCGVWFLGDISLFSE